jgi:hypothetical protein
MLRIVWATRSIVCSCGARLTPPKREKGSGEDESGGGKAG